MSVCERVCVCARMRVMPESTHTRVYTAQVELGNGLLTEGNRDGQNGQSMIKQKTFYQDFVNSSRITFLENKLWNEKKIRVVNYFCKN